jgi:hypothetical protein
VTAFVDVELWHDEHHLFTVTSPPIHAPQATTFRTAVHIPGDFLNEQQYQARFRVRALGHHDGGSAPAVSTEERFDFRVINIQRERSVWNEWTGTSKGFIGPRLTWRLSREQ